MTNRRNRRGEVFGYLTSWQHPPTPKISKSIFLQRHNYSITISLPRLINPGALLGTNIHELFKDVPQHH